MLKEKKYYLTKEGLKKIKEEYKRVLELKKKKSKEGVPPVLHSEELNTEFVSFQEDLEFLKSRIETFEDILKNFELIKIPPKRERDKVYLGAQTKVELDGEIDEFTIVGTLEADPAKKKLSDESPIGKALLGHKIGDKVVMKTEMVERICKILEIRYT